MIIPNKIETEKIYLRKLLKGDLDEFQKLLSESSTNRFLMFSEKQKNRKGSKELLDKIVQSYLGSDPYIAMAIASKEKNKFLGLCGLSPIEHTNIYELYYGLLPEHQKKGFATEAASALLDYFLATYEIREVRAYMSPRNPGSARVAARLGMNYEGIHKHPVFKTEKMVYSIQP